MNHDARSLRTVRRVISAAVAIASLALVSTTASNGAAPVAILHPMQPIGNIDCCH